MRAYPARLSAGAGTRWPSRVLPILLPSSTAHLPTSQRRGGKKEAKEGGRGKKGALWLTLAALLALPPLASAEHAPCEPEAIDVAPAPGVPVGLAIEERACAHERGRFVSLAHPSGRLGAAWHEDERGVGVSIVHAPYFVVWEDGPRGCTMLVYAFALGATELACAAGAPPPPP